MSGDGRAEPFQRHRHRRGRGGGDVSELHEMFFVERSVWRDTEFCRVGGPMQRLEEAQERFAAVLTLAPKSTVRLRRGREIFAEAHYGNVARHDPPRRSDGAW
jgi:hypothetical protein